MEDKKNISKKMILYALISCALCAMLIAVFHELNVIHEIRNEDNKDIPVYKAKYAFVSSDDEDELVKAVYDAAFNYGAQRDIYVEDFGALRTGNYSIEELLQMAVYSAPDGIILCGDNDEEINDVINQAVDKGIPVVTCVSDREQSKRQCYVGSNYYTMGMEYAKALEELVDSDDDTCLLMVPETLSTVSRNTLITTIMGELASKNRNIVLDVQPVDTSDNFVVEEKVRDLILDSNASPDVVICLNPNITSTMYRMLVDYNRVGDISVIGYYNSESILKGIYKKVIYSSVTVDAVAIGENSVKAVSEYIDTGFVSDYIPVDVERIDGDNVEKYLN
ncbi:MAG: substrate-binding domain-containing protein [Lachnospiraceae bacterium]|nr:substrate-binding domain-containing protein [Lachnospiraceae bacterium]